MRLPTLKKILREDVSEAPSWITRVIEPFNSLAENVYQAFNRNITYSENIRCFIKEITYKTTSLYPVMETVEFINELKVKPTGLQVLQALDKDTFLPASGPVYVPWVENNGKIVVSSITGLSADKTYVIRLLVT